MLGVLPNTFKLPLNGYQKIKFLSTYEKIKKQKHS